MGALDVITRFLADTGGLEKGADSAAKKLEGFGASGLAAAAGPLALATAGAAAVAAIGMMTSAAAEDRAEQEKLNAAIVAAGAATGDYTAQVEAAIEAGQARAFSDSETRAGLQSLVTATGDVGEATALLATAQDVARFAGVDLATASDAVAKAAAGQDGSLRKLIPGLAKGASATDTLAAASAAAAGQADLFASSTEGSMAKAQDAFGELGEEVGSAFLPIIDELVPAILPVVELLGELIKAVMPALIAIVKLVVGALRLLIDALLVVVDWVRKVIDWLGPRLQPVLKAVMDTAGKVSDAIGGIGSAIGGLIDWIRKGIEAIGRFLDKLNPLKDFKMPSLPALPFSAALGGPAPVGVGAQAAGARAVTTGAITVNVYTQGDSIAAEQAVVRALRRVTRINGGQVAARGWSRE